MSVRINSRYRGLSTYEIKVGEGPGRSTIAIRANSPPAAGTALFRHRITGVENVEYMAWRLLGSSQAWWRLADANPLVFPLDLRPGDSLTILKPLDGGRVERDRVF
jgi:hypothetical protein